jgi:hypothetical protein
MSDDIISGLEINDKISGNLNITSSRNLVESFGSHTTFFQSITTHKTILDLQEQKLRRPKWCSG